MLRPIDQYFTQKEEPARSCLQFMRAHILQQDPIQEIDHPDLLQEQRARMKILLLDPHKDIPVRKINAILKKMLALYR